MTIEKTIKLILEINQFNSQILYHYNTKPLNILYTLRKQHKLGITKLSLKQLKEADLNRTRIYYDKYAYIDHISLFLDPIPLDIVRKHFTGNKVYQSNDYIYEHQIRIDQLKDNLLYYKLVENPINNFMSNHLWIDSDIIKPIYFGARKILNITKGYNGSNYSKLLNIIAKFKGKTQQAFEELVNSDKFDDEQKSMYAPSIPHLFIYPTNGELMISKVIKKNFKD